jgi:uncharacterized protein YbjT (DUF2867 family)
VILVVGATGTVGSALLDLLCVTGREVRALVRSPERGDDLRGVDCEVVVGDLGEPASLAAPLRGVEAVFLATPFSGRQAELEGNLVAAAARAGAPHVVKLAAMGVEDDAVADPITTSHRTVLEQLAASGLPHSVLAPTSFCQNLLRDAAHISAGRLSRVAGDAAMAHVDARDVAAVAARLLTSPPGDAPVHLLTGPAAVRWSQVAALLSDVTGREVRYQPVSLTDYADALAGAGLPPDVVAGLCALAERQAAGGAETVTDTVQRLTDQPPRSLDGFLRDYQGAFRTA